MQRFSRAGPQYREGNVCQQFGGRDIELDNADVGVDHQGWQRQGIKDVRQKIGVG
jgi:hypothetical protein